MAKSMFLNMIKNEMFKLRYAKRTIESYLKWISSYIHFHQKKHPNLMHDTEVEAFLSHLECHSTLDPLIGALIAWTP
jgi:hypothetical protein